MIAAFTSSVITDAEVQLMALRACAINEDGLETVFDEPEARRLIFWALAAMRGWRCASEDPDAI